MNAACKPKQNLKILLSERKGRISLKFNLSLSRHIGLLRESNADAIYG